MIWFHRSKDFEAIKAGKLAIRPWLSCQYTENTLMDEPSDLDWQNSATSNSARTAKTRLWSKMYVPLLAVF